MNKSASLEIPLSVPSYTSAAAGLLSTCLEEGWVSTVGSNVKSFEQLLSNYVQSKNCSATNSGTAALHLALLSSGILKDQEVIVPCLSFIASVNPVRYIGAHPIFVDALSDTWNIDTSKIRQFLSDECNVNSTGCFNKVTGRQITAIIPVHIFGNPADLLELQAIAKEYSLQIIEDASEALGSFYNERHVGNFGTCGVFSFNGNKIITTGAGGALVSDSSAIIENANHLKMQAKSDPLAYQHDDIGFNYGLSNLHAALGISQLSLLPKILEEKQKIYKIYLDALSSAVEKEWVTFQKTTDSSKPNHWLNCILINKTPKSKDSLIWKRVYASLAENKIQSRPIWAPLHLHEMYKNCQRIGGEITADLCYRGLCLPSSASLTATDQERVIDVLLKTLEIL